MRTVAQIKMSHMKKKKKRAGTKKEHLTYEDRVKIEGFLSEDYSYQAIATAIKRSKSAVGYEVKKNGGRKKYSATKAERRARLLFSITPSLSKIGMALLSVFSVIFLVFCQTKSYKVPFAHAAACARHDHGLRRPCSASRRICEAHHAGV